MEEARGYSKFNFLHHQLQNEGLRCHNPDCSYGCPQPERKCPRSWSSKSWSKTGSQAQRFHNGNIGKHQAFWGVLFGECFLGVLFWGMLFWNAFQGMLFRGDFGVKLVVKHNDFTMETLVRSTELPWAFFIAPFHQFLIFVNFQELFYPDNKEFLFFFSIVILLYWY